MKGGFEMSIAKSVTMNILILMDETTKKQAQQFFVEYRILTILYLIGIYKFVFV